MKFELLSSSFNGRYNCAVFSYGLVGDKLSLFCEAREKDFLTSLKITLRMHLTRFFYRRAEFLEKIGKLII